MRVFKKMTVGLGVLVGLSMSVTSYAASKALIISGGGSPASNHYSQYLQTNRLARFLQSKLGFNNISVYFGAGNSSKKPKIYPDVHSETKKYGKKRHDVFFGVIPGNHSARKANIKEFFETVAPQKVASNDTFFLFVSDHGMPNKEAGGFENNCIDLWSYDQKNLRDESWDKKCLSVNETKALLKKNIKAKRTLFAMTQCFSGGFHRLSVDPDEYYPTANQNICGFTAVTEDLPASGCTPAVSEDNYQGYERYFTQQFVGHNVITGRKMNYGRKSTIKDAHYAAAVEDMTVDIPTSTSEYLLQSWYDTIKLKDFDPRTDFAKRKELHKLLQSVIEDQMSEKQLLDQAGLLKSLVKEKLGYLNKLKVVLAEYNPGSAAVIQSGGETAIMDRIDEIQKEMGRVAKISDKVDKHYWKTRYEKLYKYWAKAFHKNEIDLSKEEKETFEPYFLNLESVIKGDANKVKFIDNEQIYAIADAMTEDPKSAKAFSKYYSNRDETIYKWALDSGDKNLIRTVNQLKEWKTESESYLEPIDRLDREYSHLLRIVYLRQQIAAALALVQMKDQNAIDDVLGLAQCEETRI